MNDTNVEEMSGDQLIKFYFKLGLQNKDIRQFLILRHNHTISNRHLKRILKKLHLYRRKQYSSINDIIHFFDKQLQSSSQLHDYRTDGCI